MMRNFGGEGVLGNSAGDAWSVIIALHFVQVGLVDPPNSNSGSSVANLRQPSFSQR